MEKGAWRRKYSRIACHPLRLFVPVAFALSFVTALFLLYSYSANIASYTKSVAGDNLQPTPWHPFPRSEPENWKKVYRAPKLLKCSYISCLPSVFTSTPFSRLRHNSSASCPSFFQWIHEDLAPWRTSQITKKNLEEAKKFAAFRVIIVSGRLYTELYYHCVQTRTMFTLWGILKLLERYPGMVPDVDFMFNCMDRPHFLKKNYSNGKIPPPLFAYCSNKASFDIPFPDWSYWGWAEANIGPWEQEAANVFDGSKQLKWKDRKPNAFWKGNPNVGAPVRVDLLSCNKTKKNDYGALIYKQDWLAEAQEGFKNSNLSRQCGHRYKIYAEGHAWSVSFKYIMACGSTLLLIRPEYYDFFMRGLLPRHHYWPVDRSKMCPSLKFAVDYGNSHPEEAEEIGRNGQEFLKNELSMDQVYDYMLHMLIEYSKLQKFKPVVPPGAQSHCFDSILCIAEPKERQLLEKTLEAQLNKSLLPCSMPKRDEKSIKQFINKERDVINAIQTMQDPKTKKSPKKSRQHRQKTVN